MHERTLLHNVLLITLSLLIIITLFCFIGFMLGYDGLLLVGQVELSETIYGMISYSVFVVQLTFMGCFILRDYTRRIFLIVLPFAIPCFVILGLTGIPRIVCTTLLPLIYFMSISIFRRDSKGALVRSLIFTTLVMVYQGLALMVKVGRFELGYNELEQYEWLMSSIDLIIFCLVVFAIGGEKYYVGLGQYTREHFLFPEAVQDFGQDNEDAEVIEAWRRLEGFKRVKAMSLLLIFQIAQWTIILFVCAIGNVLVEGLIITTSFVVYGFLIQKRWHSKSLIVCTLMSAAMFYLAAKLTPSFGYTQLFPVIVGLFLIYSLYRVGIYVGKRKKVEEGES